MNKKLTILIVAIECVFAVFLVSIFGPMVESLHAKVVVKNIYILDEQGQRLEPNANLTVDLDVSRSFRFGIEVQTDEATDKRVSVTHNLSDSEIEIEQDVDGFGFTVHFLKKSISSVKIFVTARDSSQKQTILTLNKKPSDINIGDDF